MVNSKKISKAIINSKSSDGLVKFLQTHELLSVLPNVLRRVEAEARKEAERKTLKVRASAQSHIEPSIEGVIREKLGAGDAKIEIHEDKQLAAGFVARYQDLVFDASASNQLYKLKKSIIRK